MLICSKGDLVYLNIVKEGSLILGTWYCTVKNILFYFLYCFELEGNFNENINTSSLALEVQPFSNKNPRLQYVWYSWTNKDGEKNEEKKDSQGQLIHHTKLCTKNKMATR